MSTPIATGTGHVDDASTLAALAGSEYGTVEITDGDETLELQAVDGAVRVTRDGEEVRADGGVATPDADTRPQWADGTVRCECGAAVTNWHSPVRAREILRMYGNGDGEVLACPSCLQARTGADSDITTVPKAIVKLRREQP